MEFLKIESLESARLKLLDSAKGWLVKTKIVSLHDSLGLISGADVFATEDSPAFRRSTVDGYAVLSADTQAASDGVPVFLSVVGSVDIGTEVTGKIRSGECMEVPTGGMLPAGADAVVMVEYSEEFGAEGVAISSGVAFGENVINIGDDAKKGTLILPRGKTIRAQDIGVLASFGVGDVCVFASPKVTVVSTGDELTSTTELELGKVRDINSHAIAALACKNGFDVIKYVALPDNEEILTQEVRTAMADSDVVILSGGSSKGKKDLTRLIFEKLAKPGVYTHGIALKPGKPTILAHDESSKTIFVGLPGHPVSAIVVFELLISWLIGELTNRKEGFAIPARLSHNIGTTQGKVVCIPCRLEESADGYIATAVFGKSGAITTLTQADGYFITERNTEGLLAGAVVYVNIF